MRGQSWRSVWRAFLVQLLAAGILAIDGSLAVGSVPGDLSPLPSGCSPTDDMTTGGGWLTPPAKPKRTFGFEAGLGPNAPFPGRLVFVNHLTKERLDGDIIAYTGTATTRDMTGSGRLDGAPAVFELEVTDATRDGSGDSFLLHILIPSRPPEGLLLGGGNIQIHPMCPPSLLSGGPPPATSPLS
jgi:hypothetical protein